VSGVGRGKTKASSQEQTRPPAAVRRRRAAAVLSFSGLRHQPGVAWSSPCRQVERVTHGAGVALVTSPREVLPAARCEITHAALLLAMTSQHAAGALARALTLCQH